MIRKLRSSKIRYSVIRDVDSAPSPDESHRHHARHDQTVLSVSRPLRRCELDSRQLRTVADRKFEVWTRSEQSSNSHRHTGHDTDRTVLSCLVWRCELGIKLQFNCCTRSQTSSFHLRRHHRRRLFCLPRAKDELLPSFSRPEPSPLSPSSHLSLLSPSISLEA